MSIEKTFTCQYCGEHKKNKNSLSVHSVYCNLNPERKIANNQDTRKKKTVCSFCNEEFFSVGIKHHKKSCSKNPKVLNDNGKTCPICKTVFLGKSKTCSYSCSNSLFRHKRPGGTRYIETEDLLDTDKYRDICFRFHERKCVVCGEDKIVEVHHYNGNHSDNRIENLIPLCPTHHKYCHSRHKILITDKIETYYQSVLIKISIK